jgi:hypothetical protein
MSVTPGTVTKVRGNKIEFVLTNGKTIKVVADKLNVGCMTVRKASKLFAACTQTT